MKEQISSEINIIIEEIKITNFNNYTAQKL